MKEKRLGKAIIYHIVVFIIGVIMIYPLLWMVMSSFKETGTIFTTAGSLIPETFTLENYTNGWKGFAKVPFSAFFKNSMLISVLATLGTIMSSALVAYGFARFKFFGHNILFAAMLVTMMLPAQVLMIPQYLWYQKLGWVGTYLPLIVPYFFATQGFFVYMISNFIGGIPKELDEAAKIDGCSYWGIFVNIMLPLIKPALVTSCIFSFIWRRGRGMDPDGNCSEPPPDQTIHLEVPEPVILPKVFLHVLLLLPANDRLQTSFEDIAGLHFEGLQSASFHFRICRYLPHRSGRALPHIQIPPSS